MLPSLLHNNNVGALVEGALVEEALVEEVYLFLVDLQVDYFLEKLSMGSVVTVVDSAVMEEMAEDSMAEEMEGEGEGISKFPFGEYSVPLRSELEHTCRTRFAKLVSVLNCVSKSRSIPCNSISCYLIYLMAMKRANAR